MDPYSKHILSFDAQLGFDGLAFSCFDHLKAGHYDAVVVAGMGGSGLPGELLNGVREELGLDVPVAVWHDYGAPKHSFRNPFHVFVSFSGNTEEVVSAFNEVGSHHPRAVIAGGGALLKLAHESMVPAVSFAKGTLAPRQATGLMSYALFAILKKAMPHLRVPELSKKIKPAQFRARGHALSKKIKNKIVLLYAPTEYGFLAHDWKIRINETAKTPSFTALLPELNHNEIAGFQTKRFGKEFFVVFLHDPKQGARLKKRIELTKKLLSGYNVGSEVVTLSGATKLTKAFNGILFAEWTSYFLAKANGVDPYDTELIEKFKKLMK